MNIVCIGDCGIDHYLPDDELLVGGISANFARHARDMFPRTDDVHLVSVVGDDRNGEVVVAALADRDISCHITRAEGLTPVQYIEVRDDGERDFVRYEAGVLRDFRLGPDEQRIAGECDLLVVPAYLQIVGLFEEVIRIPHGGRTSVDFADFVEHPDFSLLERSVPYFDIGFFGLSVTEREMIRDLEHFSKEHARLLVVTLGAAGSLAFYKGRRYEQAAVRVPAVVDTTGAGDAFAAAFLSRYCYRDDIADALASGANLAARVVQVHGTGFAPRAP